MPSTQRPPRGWSHQGAARFGSRRRTEGEGCYYCGVTTCKDCGEPPAMLQQSGFIPDTTEDENQ